MHGGGGEEEEARTGDERNRIKGIKDGRKKGRYDAATGGSKRVWVCASRRSRCRGCTMTGIRWRTDSCFFPREFSKVLICGHVFLRIKLRLKDYTKLELIRVHTR